MKIYKYVLEIKGEQELNLPADWRFLSIQLQGDAICMWAIVNEELEKVPRKIYCYGTGHDVGFAANKKYLGTVQQNSFVWHFFCKS